ncbi:MAG: hypothetical protein WCX17_03575 [Parcubacteria group bacterium]
MYILTRDEVEKFFCPLCNVRVDLCSCEEYRDQGCWDCGPNCRVNNRRKDKKALQEYLSAGNSVPRTRPSKMLEETEQPSPCCKEKMKRLLMNKVISGIFDVEYIAHVCSKCGAMYHLP